MKTIINKLRYTLLLGFLALAALGNSLHAETLEICNGSVTNGQVPLYGTYFDDNYQLSQMIYPESLLTEMIGGRITSLTFYSNNADNLSALTGGSFNIRVGMTSISTFNATPSRITSGMELVASNKVVSNCVSGATLVINFDSDFTYTGGNLVIEYNSTQFGSAWKSLSFYGQQYTSASYAAKSNYTSSPTGGTTQNFLPHVTFGYEPSSSDPTISANPLTVDFEARPGGSDSKTVTVRGRNLTGDINVSGPSGGIFSVSPSSFTPTDGIVDNETLTITYTPSEVGTHNAIVTLSSAGADPVYIELNGTCEKAVTVCDGTNTNGNLPIYGYYIDNYQINQMIYPADELANLVGTDLTSMTFYTDGNIHEDLETSTWTVKLGITDETVFANTLANSTRLEPDIITTVASGYVVTSGINTMTIVFNTPFSYYGGNLLVDFESTAHTSDYEATNFYGVTQATGHNTGFHSYGSSNTPGANGHYSGGNIDAFLPKVKFTYVESEPVTNGTVTPNSVALSAAVGNTATQTVTLRNTGNQPFTPTIDVTDLPEGITVGYTPNPIGEMSPGSTVPLTVTFAPTEECEVSGTFTVTIPVPDDDPIVLTVTVTGSGYVISSTLTSNTVEIPVYKSGVKADGTYIFSQEDVENDIDMSLSYEDAGFDLQVLVKSDEPIVRYDLHHKVGDGNWTYPDGTAVATATHSGNTYVVDEETFTIPQDATELWIPMTDEGVDATEEISYVPVTVANSIVAGGTQGNTYGAPISTLETDEISLEVQVGGSKSDQRPGGHWTQTLPNGDEVEYCVYTPVITINSEDLSGQVHVPYMFRAWLIGNDDVTYYDFDRNSTTGYLYGTQPLDMPKPLGELVMETTAIGSTTFTIGRDWIAPEGNNPNDWDTQLENAFAAPCEGANVYVVVRAYYQKAATRGNRDGGGYGFGQGGGDGEGIATWVMELNSDRQVVGVTYVNPMGMTSDRPFEGVNIIITRYSDGSCRTSKVLF